MPLFLLDKCAACSKDLAFNAPRCVRCHVRYCDSTYDKKVAMFGYDDGDTLNAALALAESLAKTGQCAEGISLMRETIPKARKYFGADSDIMLRLTSTLGNAICLNEASSLDDLAEAEKLFSDNLRKSTRLHGSNHPTTAQLAHQLKSAHELISAMRLRDRARREEAAGGKKTFHERAFAPGWLE